MNEWIKTKDKLPDDGERVLAFNGEIHEAVFNKNPGHGIASIWESKYAKDNWGLMNVTLWMPMPEIPK